MKKAMFLVLSLIMLMAVPMTVCADVEEDYSPKTTTSDSTSKKDSKSPKTADNGMTEIALALLAISGGVLCISRKELKRA